MSSALSRVKASVARALGRSRAYYTDPAGYWDRRHKRFGTKLEGVGTIHMAEELNEAEYDRKWRHVRVVLESLLAPGGSTLLDAGCGNGYFARRAAELGFVVDGVDFSEEAVGIASSTTNGVTWYVSALQDFAPGKTYDVVMSIDVLFHIVDDSIWGTSLRNIAGLVGESGVLVVQEHLVPGHRDDHDGAAADGTTHVRWRDQPDYLSNLPGWQLVSNDHYDLPESESWKDLMVFRHAPDDLRS